MSAIRRDRVSGLVGAFDEERVGRADTVAGGTLTLAAGCATWQNIDANGAARNVKLPDEASSLNKVLYITNFTSGAFALTLQSSAGGALSPATTVAQNKGVLVICDGVNWKPMIVGA